MRHYWMLAAATAALPLAAAALAQGAGQKLRPGLWETSMEVHDMQMQGMPAGVSPDMLKRMRPARTVSRNCITAKQAANPTAEMLAAQKAHNCTARKVAMAAGTISIAMSCTDARRGSKMDMVMTGRYAPESYAMNGDMKMNAAGGMAMRMKTRTSGKWVGACKS